MREGDGPDPEELAYRRLVGQRVRRRRRALKLSQQQIADAVGVSRNYISDLEQGQHAVNAWRVVRLSVVLQAPAPWLLDPTADRRGIPRPAPDPPQLTRPARTRPSATRLEDRVFR